MTHQDRPSPEATDDTVVAMIRELGPEPPSQVDVDAAVRRGEHRIRRRILTVAGVAAVTVLTVAAAPTALTALSGRDHHDRQVAASGSPSPGQAGPKPPAACRLSRLPEPAGAYQSYVTAADPTGRYVAARTYFPSGRKLRQAIWDNGTLRNVDIPGEDGAFNDVNARGLAVGSSFVGDGTRAAWIYRDGRVSRLPGDNAEARAVNEAGDVVGMVHKGLIEPRPVIWRGGQGAPVPLPVPAGFTDGSAMDIADDGLIVGSVRNATTNDLHAQPYLWLASGEGRPLPLSPEHLGGGGDAIRGDWVIGRGSGPVQGSDVDGFKPLVLRWNLRTNHVETVNHRFTSAAINRYGWIAGGWGTSGSALIAGSATIALPGLGAGRDNPGPTHDLVVNVTDDGRTIAGHAHDKGGKMHAVVWRCT